MDGENAPLPFFALDSQTPAECFDEPLRKGQPDPRPAIVVDRQPVPLRKRLHDRLQLILRYAYAGIPDCDREIDRLIRLVRDVNGHIYLALICEFDRVVEEVS